MIWIQENKGLAAFLGLCLVGCAALGFMLFGSYQGYSAAYSDFDAARKQVGSLEQKPLFPDEESVALKKGAVAAYEKEVSELRSKLVKFQRPLNGVLTGNQFQGRLAERVERIQELAGRKSVELPEEFRLDFDRWVNQPAPQGAVAKLDFQLEAISDLVTTAIGSGISAVNSVTRTPLAEEKGGEGAGSKPAGSVAPLLERYPVEMTFTTSHKGLENLLNSLSNASRTPNHFFIVRLMEIQNEAMSGPLKEDAFTPEPIYSDQPVDPGVPPVDPGVDPEDPTIPAEPAVLVPAPTFGAGDPVAYRDMRVLLGEEELKAFLKVEIIRFKPDLKKGDGDGPKAAGS